MNEINDIIFNLTLEGYRLEFSNDYIIAYRMSVIARNEEDEDFEFEIHDFIKSEMNDQKLIFSISSKDSEIFRIIDIPEIENLEFENGNFTLLENANINLAIEFLKNIQTIKYSKLHEVYNNQNKNNKWINDKSEIIKTYHENGQIKEEIETLNNKWHGLYKLYHENGQLLVVTRFENEKQVDGIVDSYDDNGTLIRTVIIKNGNFNGPFKEFYPSGTIKKEGEYKEGEIIGIPIEYFEDGNVIRSKRNDSNINFASGKTKDNPESNEVESTNKYINTVLTNKEFKDIIDSYIKNEKVKNFELNISISKWYGYTPFKCSGEFDGHNFISEIVEVCKWGICEHNYKDLNKLLNDIKDYEIDELHKHLDIEIIREDEDFEIDFIKWEKGTPDEFIEEIEEDWGAFDIRDNSTEEEQLDFIFKEGSIIDEIQILLSNDDSTFKLSWINSKENEENDKVISTLKHVNEYNNNLLVEAITKTGNAFNDNDKSYDFYENGQYQEGINSVKKALEIIPNNSTFLDTLALGYYYLGDYNSAFEISNNCIDFDIEKDSENAEHYSTRAKINIKLNKIENAIKDLKIAIKLDPDFEEAIQLLETIGNN